MGTEKPASAVVVLPLVEGVSLVLARDEQGWRFGWWGPSGGNPANTRYGPPPATGALEKRYETPEAAAAYFRKVWKDLW